MRTLLMLSMILFLSQQAIAGEAQQQGRYQIVTGTHATYLLDSLTGKVWHLVQFSDFAGEHFVWKFMDRADDYKAYATWLRSHPTKKQVEEYEASEAAKKSVQ